MAVEPVLVVPYDSSWPALFVKERARIEEAVGRCVEDVEHVGSTAIPGLDAKPVIDVMAGLRSMQDAERCIEPLVNLGYSYWTEGAEPHHLLFVKFLNLERTARTHNLHLVEVGSRYWEERLLFRDYLRYRPEIALEYARLKHKLAGLYRDDREAYTAAKTNFVSKIVNRASSKP